MFGRCWQKKMSQVKLKFFVMDHVKPHNHPQKCDFYGCASDGAYRAPKSREHLRDYYWFCLSHIRDYNARWDYFKDMDAQAIQAQLSFDDVWNRPTRPFGHRRREAPHRPILPLKVEQALLVLEVQFPFTLDHLKAQYKLLVKAHHPDLHGQDVEKQERLKAINLAYDVLHEYFGEET